MSVSLIITAGAAFLAAVLSGLGLGSAGIFVRYLTFVAGLPQVEAQGINLLFFLLSGGISLCLHVQHRRIPWRMVMFLTACALPGTLVGAYVARLLDGEIVRRLFGGMLVVSGLSGLVGGWRAKGQR